MLGTIRGDAVIHDLKNEAASLAEGCSRGAFGECEALRFAKKVLDFYESLLLVALDGVTAGVWSSRVQRKVEERRQSVRRLLAEGRHNGATAILTEMRAFLVADYVPGSPVRGIADVVFFGHGAFLSAVRAVVRALLADSSATPLRAWWERDGEYLQMAVTMSDGRVFTVPIRLPVRVCRDLDGGVLLDAGPATVLERRS